MLYGQVKWVKISPERVRSRLKKVEEEEEEEEEEEREQNE